MTNLDQIIAERDRLWDVHPIITESAILPTRAVQDAVARVVEQARRTRSSTAFWARPLTGKSSCIRAIASYVQARIPGAGVLILEAVEDKSAAEGRQLATILKAANFAHKIDSTLAGKRDQVKRTLLALAGHRMHLFLFIDEAQELSDSEFAWLKAVINAQTNLGVKISVVLFGQEKLRARRTELKSKRSDLLARFMKSLRTFHGCRSAVDFAQICDAIDARSEFPAGSGWTYLQLLFPKAFDGGFRLASISGQIWGEIKASGNPFMRDGAFSMELVASVLANLMIGFREADANDMSWSEERIRKYVAAGVSA